MALLPVEKRKELFKELGLGEYNEANILKLQKKYLLRKSDHDKIYGENTDNLLRHLKAVKDNCKNFAPEEFRCGCGGRYCSGYPTYMKPIELKNVQSIRSHYGKQMILTCGLRCPAYNKAVGGITNSEHLKGLAVDYYIAGVTDTLANRKSNINWISRLPNHHYTYGNGIYVETANGKIRTGYTSAPGMGNAMHTDSRASAPIPAGKLAVDGIGGAATVARMQEFFSVTQDGVISGQNRAQSKYYPSLTAVSYGSGGSATIKKLQKWTGVTQDGILGQATVKAWQKKIGAKVDGIFGTESMKRWQTYLNENDKPVYPPDPKPRKQYKVIDVSEWQGDIDWKKVKADGVVGAIIRFGDGDYKDVKFDANMKGAKAAGLHVGAYIFSRAGTAAQAKKEANLIYSHCKKYAPDMPIYIDLEDNSKRSAADTVAMAYLAEIKSLGGRGGVYANVSWWNNYLTKTAATNPIMWVAQYYKECQYKPISRVGMWQYSSSGKVAGIKGNVDMDWCYVEYWKDAPKPAPEKQGYQGKFPTIKLVKTNEEVIADAIEWAKWIAKDNDFHYGYGRHAHHNGCYFCGTQYQKKGHGIKMWDHTYCCNAFVGAAWAHGGGDATALRMCQSCDSWDFGTGSDSYDKSPLFNRVVLSQLKPGDVICSNSHAALYIGGGKCIQAAGGDDNVIRSKAWNESIDVGTWDGYKRAYRYNGSVNVTRPIREGEVSARVLDLKKFLIWYGYKLDANKIFSANTKTAVEKFQKANGLTVDGIVGELTIAKMKEVKK